MRTRRAAVPVSGPFLCVMRHADAGDALADSERDALRPLSEKGRRQAKRTGKALRRLGLAPADVFSSRLVRALATAGVALRGAKSKARVVPTATLSPGADPERIVRLLVETPPAAPEETGAGKPSPRRAAGRRMAAPLAGPVVRWVVGHEPALSRLVGFLTAAQPQGVELKKGAVAVLECGPDGPEAGGCRLTALLSPDAVRALLHDGR